MNDDNLSPKPEPVIEEKEHNPGGVDAIPDVEVDDNLGRDLHPDNNPGVDDALPDEITASDGEKSQAPEGKADEAEKGADDDPDAGQLAEDGSAEPPA